MRRFDVVVIGGTTSGDNLRHHIADVWTSVDCKPASPGNKTYHKEYFALLQRIRTCSVVARRRPSAPECKPMRHGQTFLKIVALVSCWKTKQNLVCTELGNCQISIGMLETGSSLLLGMSARRTPWREERHAGGRRREARGLLQTRHDAKERVMMRMASQWMLSKTLQPTTCMQFNFRVSRLNDSETDRTDDRIGQPAIRLARGRCVRRLRLPLRRLAADAMDAKADAVVAAAER